MIEELVGSITARFLPELTPLNVALGIIIWLQWRQQQRFFSKMATTLNKMADAWGVGNGGH